jgi:hypothetical protein
VQVQLVLSAKCPEYIKNIYRESVVQSKSASERMSERCLDKLREELDGDFAESVSSLQSAKKKARQDNPADIRSYTDRKLSAEEVKEIDILFARFCFTEGLAFRTFKNAEFHSALAKLNAEYAQSSRLSDWCLRHHFLDDEYG